MDSHRFPENYQTHSQLSTTCLLHKASVINKFSIKKCSYKYNNGIWYHVIYLSEPKEVQPLNVGILKSVSFKYNESNKVSEIWEHLKARPISSMYTLEHDCSSNILKLLITNLVECICQLTLEEIVDQTLIFGKKNTDEIAKFFLSNIATVSEKQGNFCFFLLNRFTLESIKNLPCKTKVRYLKKQLFMIHPLIKCFYFRKKYDSDNKTHSKSKVSDFCKDCSLMGYIPHYIHINIQELHNHFCIMNKKTSKMQGLLNLSIDMVYQAVQFVSQLEANTTSKKL